MQKLIVSPSPHIHADISTRKIMLDVIIALLPATIVSIVFYGWRELSVILVSVLGCVGVEWLICKYLMKKKSTVRDLSAVVTGLILALNLPSTTPWWVVLIGALVAIGVTKMSFGGLGQNVFNPAMAARVFLLLSFPVYMTTWAQLDMHNAWSFGVDALTGPTFLSMFKEGAVDSDSINLMIHNGSAGEVSCLALLAGFVYLLIRRVLKPWITLSIWATVLLFALVLWLISPETNLYPQTVLLTGGIMMGSIFMATDYVTSPVTTKGGIVFGVGIGLISMIIRYYGAYPEGVSFAILIMNACVPLINRLFTCKPFGRE